MPDAYPDLDALSIAVTPACDTQALRRIGLTKRQAEVQALAIRGLNTPEIADQLCLSPRTVEKHFEAIYNRLGVRTPDAGDRRLRGSDGSLKRPGR